MEELEKKIKENIEKLNYEFKTKKYINGNTFRRYEEILLNQNEINVQYKEKINELMDQNYNLSQKLNQNEEQYAEKINELMEQINMLSKKLTNVEINIQCNNRDIELLKSKSDKLEVKLSIVKRNKYEENISYKDREQLVQSIIPPERKNEYEKIDYYDFEDYFRGSREWIKETQQQYVSYFIGKKNVIDIGCGRGEFLELMRNNEIGATGVDLYPEFVELCKMNELQVYCCDAIQYLNEIEKADGIFAGQLVEHLSVDQLVEICNLAYQKLEKNCYIILETPNPKTLSIYSNAFYMDPSHIKPVHPLTLRYLLEKAGFRDIQIVFTKESRIPVSIPELGNAQIENLAEFNEAMKVVSELLFGSQDYAIIAKK